MDWQANHDSRADGKRAGGRWADSPAIAARIGPWYRLKEWTRFGPSCPNSASTAAILTGAARASADHRCGAAASSDRVATHPTSDYRISVLSRGLSGVRREHACDGTAGSEGTLRPTTDGADRVFDGSLPHAAPGGGSAAGAGAGDRDQFGKHAKVLGRSQPGGGRSVPGTGTAIEG